MKKQPFYNQRILSFSLLQKQFIRPCVEIVKNHFTEYGSVIFLNDKYSVNPVNVELSLVNQIRDSACTVRSQKPNLFKDALCVFFHGSLKKRAWVWPQRFCSHLHFENWPGSAKTFLMYIFSVHFKEEKIGFKSINIWRRINLREFSSYPAWNSCENEDQLSTGYSILIG